VSCFNIAVYKTNRDPSMYHMLAPVNPHCLLFRLFYYCSI
jgi:hypothetical protein